jgi:hypothetical protein
MFLGTSHSTPRGFLMPKDDQRVLLGRALNALFLLTFDLLHFAAVTIDLKMIRNPTLFVEDFNRAKVLLAEFDITRRDPRSGQKPLPRAVDDTPETVALQGC